MKGKVPDAVVTGNKRLTNVPMASESPEKLFDSKVEADFWRKIILEAVHSGCDIDSSREFADQLLQDYRLRNKNISE